MRNCAVSPPQPARARRPAVAPTRRTPLDTAALTAALQKYDATAIDQQISRLAAVLPPLELLRDVLMPVLAQVGDDWHRGPARIAHEHLMSSTMRNILGSFLRLYARPEVSIRLLFATLAGERHEIGTLGAAMLAASSGLGVAYLGPDLPAREIVESVRPAGAQVLVLGLTTTSAGKARERELRAIVRDLPKEVELWAGGRGAERHAALISPRGLVLRDYNAYQQELVRLGGRVRVTPVSIPRQFRPVARSCVSVVLTAAVLTLVATSASAQDTTGVGAISGVVVNAAGQPAGGVRVCALDTASCATSDARGAFRIGELRAGVVSAGDPAPRRPALHQRSGGRARRAGRHRGNHAAHGGGLPSKPSR